MAKMADYDTVSIHVEPDEIRSIAHRLNSATAEVAESLHRINVQLGDLKLGWAGRTQQEADDFTNRWLHVMTELFGTDAHPDTGVLCAIVDGLTAAGDAYSKTEHALADMFRDFKKQAHSGGGGGTPPGPPKDIADPTQTAITEEW